MRKGFVEYSTYEYLVSCPAQVGVLPTIVGVARGSGKSNQPFPSGVSERGGKKLGRDSA